ncbi:ankyrin repeat-containing domain protein [Mycena leptocephala]|nr:ankyrin repeat-containing domain protein [Mycena leptocephala]
MGVNLIGASHGASKGVSWRHWRHFHPARAQNIVHILLSSGVDINARGGGLGLGSALDVAWKAGHEDVVELLLDSGATFTENRGYHMLWTAAECGNEHLVRLLLRHVNIHIWKNGDEPVLHIASCQGHARVVRLLLEKGASHNGKTDVVELLLDNGADHCIPALPRLGLSVGT